VASRVVFEDGRPSKKDYRRYRVKEAQPDDDYACLREVLTRRLARVESDPLPDLLMVDGGKGQLAVVSAALADAGLEVDALGLAKERDEQSAGPRVRRSGGLKAERVFLPNRKDPVNLPASAKGLLLLQRVRDESHRFAIDYHRKLRNKRMTKSVLDDIPGLGPTRRKRLLEELGGVKKVRQAEREELRLLSWLPDAVADAVYDKTHGLERRR
jgi:excinuclease ABC subunit C